MEIRRKKDARPTYGEGLKVLVGPKEVPFFVHEGPVRVSSKFFDNAMKGPWTEAAERCVRLRDDEPDVFSIYHDWLYTRMLSTAHDVGGVEGNQEYIDLCKAYCLGESLMDDNFKNAAIDAIIHKNLTPASDRQRWYPVGMAIRHAYDGTPPGSPLRKLLVDFYSKHARVSWFSDYTSKDEMPKDFLYEVTLALVTVRSRTDDRDAWENPVQVKSLYHSQTKT
ncbi:uncharacterized protein BDZ99DRAFT_428117 [Mytilinidion resinicola]|uniref:BTB domain-containing protein n=1 Tax=Mytilinidion resinicola TaxID=574789 RepID=A0A6A6Y2H2_9PEZI|nr:uncharacterized protein BDZ99DRAFT_428117 [Mytilinidion resinicola]KAF2802713.1 hypothetical protein BDZ99DRAFT_428117 [Mytilinidion resinicola]